MAHILVVDDSNTMRQMVRFTLSSVKHTVTEAENGVQALKLAQAEKFDLVIADVNMPEMKASIWSRPYARCPPSSSPPF